jgi:hypothetical protein
VHADIYDYGIGFDSIADEAIASIELEPTRRG